MKIFKTFLAGSLLLLLSAPLVSYAQEKQDDTKPQQEEAKPAAKVPQHEEAKPAEKPAESMPNKLAQEEKRTQEGQGAEEHQRDDGEQPEFEKTLHVTRPVTQRSD